MNVEKSKSLLNLQPGKTKKYSSNKASNLTFMKRDDSCKTFDKRSDRAGSPQLFRIDGKCNK